MWVRTSADHRDNTLQVQTVQYQMVKCKTIRLYPLSVSVRHRTDGDLELSPVPVIRFKFEGLSLSVW